MHGNIDTESSPTIETSESDGKTDFSVIVCASLRGGIGLQNKLPWRLPSDMRHFVDVTTSPVGMAQGMKNAVIMGRVTWESLPKKFKPLPNRVNVVLTRNASIASLLKNEYPEIHVCPSLDAALENLGQDKEATYKTFVIGGAQVYKEALVHPRCQSVFWTQVLEDPPCDVFISLEDLHTHFEIEDYACVQRENSTDFQF